MHPHKPHRSKGKTRKQLLNKRFRNRLIEIIPKIDKLRKHYKILIGGLKNMFEMQSIVNIQP